MQFDRNELITIGMVLSNRAVDLKKFIDGHNYGALVPPHLMDPDDQWGEKVRQDDLAYLKELQAIADKAYQLSDGALS